MPHLATSSDELDPETITESLGVTPEHSYRKGDERPKGSQYYQTGAWMTIVQEKKSLNLG